MVSDLLQFSINWAHAYELKIDTYMLYFVNMYTKLSHYIYIYKWRIEYLDSFTSTKICVCGSIFWTDVYFKRTELCSLVLNNKLVLRFAINFFPLNVHLMANFVSRKCSKNIWAEQHCGLEFEIVFCDVWRIGGIVHW